MMLDRNECLMAANTLQGFAYLGAVRKDKELIDENVNHLTTLIYEHFELKEDYKILQESYNELLGNAVKLQDGICPFCDDNPCNNPPLEFGDLMANMWVWDNEEKKYRQISMTYQILGFDDTKRLAFKDDINSKCCTSSYVENRFYRYEVK